MRFLPRVRLWLLEWRVERESRRLLPKLRVELLRMETENHQRFLRSARDAGIA